MAHQPTDGRVDVNALVQRIAEPRRSLPLVIVSRPSQSKGPRVDIDELVAVIGHKAHVVYVHDQRQIEHLSDSLRARHLPTIFGGAARVYAPMPSGSVVAESQHPLVTIYEQDETTATARINAAVDSTLRSNAKPRPLGHIPLPGPRVVVADGNLATVTQLPVPQPVEEPEPLNVPEPVVITKVVHVEVPDPKDAATIARLNTQLDAQRLELAEARSTANGLTTQLRSQALAFDQKAASFDKTVRSEVANTAAAQREADRLREQLSAARQSKTAPANAQCADREHPIVYSDPETQLRHEIHQTWLETVTECERNQWPMTDYTVGVDFIASLATVKASRRKIVEIAVQIITRRAGTIPSREVRQFNLNGNPGTPQRQREDGALAWRANVAAKTPQAARFVWWVLADGSIELGKATFHDDYEIR